MSAINNEALPRGAVTAMSLLVALSVVVSAVGHAVRMNATSPASRPVAAATRLVSLRFLDQSDGSVSVRDAVSGRVVETVAPGNGGFVRGVMRGLVRDRKMRGIGPAAPFTLAQFGAASGGGALVLRDNATGREIDLDAFGATNRAAFADILAAAGHAS